MTNALERLQKVIAKSGITSRRKAEQFIQDGRVKVNGKTITILGTRVSPSDEVTVDGVPLEKEGPVYYILYKPQGVISSVKDDKNRKVVLDYFPDIDERIFPIGRLDYHTSGLLLLTNDGDFANLLLHPRYEIDKVYVAKVKGIPTKNELLKLKKGIISEKDVLRANDVSVISTDGNNNTCILQLTLHEGRNRQVHRMIQALGYYILKLKREKFGSLTLKGLKYGEYRSLTPHEVKQMRVLATKNVTQ